MAAGSTIGTIFKVTTWGESHGKAIGVVVDGCPAGLPLDESDIQKLLDRRKPGQSRFTTQRKEGDEVEILSGVFEGKTTGTPISMIVRNTDQRSRDYSNIASCFRPGHADYTFEEKYGFRDYRTFLRPGDHRPRRSRCHRREVLKTVEYLRDRIREVHRTGGSLPGADGSR